MQFRVGGSKEVEAHIFILQTPLLSLSPGSISLNTNPTNEERGTGNQLYFCHYSPFFFVLSFLSVRSLSMT